MRNILKLANYLESLSEEEFDMPKKCVIGHGLRLFNLPFSDELDDEYNALVKKLQVSKEFLRGLYVSLIYINDEREMSPDARTCARILRKYADKTLDIVSVKGGFAKIRL